MELFHLYLVTLDCFFNFKSFVTRFNFNHPSLGSSMFFPDLLFPIVGTCHLLVNLWLVTLAGFPCWCLLWWVPAVKRRYFKIRRSNSVALKNATGGKGWTGFCLAPTGAHKIRSRAGGAWRRVTCKFTGGESVKGKGVWIEVKWQHKHRLRTEKVASSGFCLSVWWITSASVACICMYTSMAGHQSVKVIPACKLLGVL